jgi:hypothetical protein
MIQRRLDNLRLTANIKNKGQPGLPGATLEGQNWVAQVNYLDCERRSNPLKANLNHHLEENRVWVVYHPILR